MAHYVKLFDSIIHSTIWQEAPHVKIVWITMLALADAKGEVQASIPGLARASGVSLEQCEDALAKFLAPDQYSRSTICEGRRIETIEGGWELINYAKYRELKSAEQERELAAIRQQRARDRQKAVTLPVTLVTDSHAASRLVTKSNDIVEVALALELPKEKECTAPADGVAGLPVVAVKRDRPIPSLDEIKTPSGIEAFTRIWSRWPKTRPADSKQAKGNRIQAEKAFQHVLSSRAASISELEAAVDVYLASHPRVLEGYPCYVSTFFGNEKAFWKESVRWNRAQVKPEVAHAS